MKKRTPKKSVARRPAAKKRPAKKSTASETRALSPEYLARAKVAARVSKAEMALRRALADLGWTLSQGETDGRVDDYHYEQRMNFRHRDHGTLFVSLAPNMF